MTTGEVEMNSNCMYKRGIEDGIEIIKHRLQRLKLARESIKQINLVCDEYLDRLRKLRVQQIHKELNGNSNSVEQ